MLLGRLVHVFGVPLWPLPGPMRGDGDGDVLEAAYRPEIQRCHHLPRLLLSNPPRVETPILYSMQPALSEESGLSDTSP